MEGLGCTRGLYFFFDFKTQFKGAIQCLRPQSIMPARTILAFCMS
jgi:hypothetical protein